MKLKRVELLENTDFRSLPKNFSIEFSKQELSAIDPKCIVGLNGSGKSNILELIAEIFFHIEMFVLYGEKIDTKDFAFEIEYTLPLLIGDPHLKVGGIFNIGSNKDVKVKKTRSGSTKFFIKPSNHNSDKYIQILDDLDTALPKKIIGYSSGQNELLSNPFLKMRFHYVEKLRSMLKSKKRFDLGRSRFFWMDYHNNNAMVISNLLLAKKKARRLLTKEIGVFAVNSFKIIIDYSKSDRKIELSNELYENIEKLKKCTPFWYEEKHEDEVIKTIIEFHVTQEVEKAFRHHFVTPQVLFEVLYQLELLNLYVHNTKIINTVLDNKNKSLNVSEEIPYDPNKQVFSIKHIKLKKFIDCNKNKRDIKIIKYKNLSDGEHQFLQIHGSMMMLSQSGNLFLLDEPETHFNPMWRSKMVKMFELIANNKEQHAQDVLLTTHSPFILSDSKKENIFKFYRDKGKVKYDSFEKSDINTYGSSISNLLEEFFGQSESIGNKAYEELLEIISEIKTLDDYKIAKNKLVKFGDSLEKFDAYNYLNQKRMELK